MCFHSHSKTFWFTLVPTPVYGNRKASRLTDYNWKINDDHDVLFFLSGLHEIWRLSYVLGRVWAYQTIDNTGTMGYIFRIIFKNTRTLKNLEWMERSVNCLFRGNQGSTCYTNFIYLCNNSLYIMRVSRFYISRSFVAHSSSRQHEDDLKWQIYEVSEGWVWWASSSFSYPAHSFWQVVWKWQMLLRCP